MDGNGPEGTYNFFSRRLGGGSRGAAHKAQGATTPCHPAGAAHGLGVNIYSNLGYCSSLLAENSMHPIAGIRTL